MRSLPPFQAEMTWRRISCRACERRWRTREVPKRFNLLLFASKGFSHTCTSGTLLTGMGSDVLIQQVMKAGQS
ncbi:protein of unknown function [Methylocella tundrae]|uniref:Uncharacterized protein n=1 Tax=Methylocella tundrae TaxID=227605 RepID=A0A4U8Z3Z3_METTU|nr:protein of unknown function [Methylocella tundrae]